MDAANTADSSTHQSKLEDKRSNLKGDSEDEEKHYSIFESWLRLIGRYMNASSLARFK